ncbi:hypothetical protein EFK50_15510 [Nocardioides marmoriginsengisoli]|uniref:Uncharacterized protein n=1 Tax=Nocardioides marmoriginsengisoli TaxID=661483 RepID=A0A3N0CJC2_9ACTN|nr:hypothetical protein [Nocardioides marmoriginsengisoli]RNL63116.1 hypothetical protein EFK50_15510 [Nocardioides marmoriginsengisoli]
MTWNAFHHRGEILQTVIDTADLRLDGVLPMDLPGVPETFHDELDLIAALSLKWHARLSGNIERELMAQPLDLEAAITHAWSKSSQEAPGIRLIIDRYTESPSDPEMAAALGRAQEKEWLKLASAAGLASDESASAARAGERVSRNARIGAPVPTGSPNVDAVATPSLVDRIRAVLAA